MSPLSKLLYAPILAGPIFPSTAKSEKRDPVRIKRILNKLETIWSEQPDMRFFQLLFNYTELNTKHDPDTGTVNDPFYYEDDDLESSLDKIIKELRSPEIANKKSV